MSAPLLATKLYIPPPRSDLIHRRHLLEEINQGIDRKLILISAPAGSGKTTLICEWIATAPATHAIGWLSLDERDNDPTRFFTYLVAALQKVVPTIGNSVFGTLQSPQPVPTETILTMLLNELAAALTPTGSKELVLVLDDYHLLESEPIDQAMAFLLDYLPPRVHLVITTREDPALPLARLRARAQLMELRAADLRFSHQEVGDFLQQALGFPCAQAEISALERRTEGWIAGLQLAALSLQGHRASDQTIADFIHSFTGSHRFVMDYLLEEVLHQQPPAVQTFLLYSSILDRMCGPLCEALLQTPPGSGEKMLISLEQANLFLTPLDNERCWYRYHHLFGELLRQKLQQEVTTSGARTLDIQTLHRRACAWYAAQGLELEAFYHATMAQDVAWAEQLIEGNGMPLHFRGAIRPVLLWLETLSDAVLDAHPSLWLAFASTLLATGQVDRTNVALTSAERLLQPKEDEGRLTERERDLLGRIAAIRATIAAGMQLRHTIIDQSERALRYLASNNIAFRTATHWKLGYAYHLAGEWQPAKQAYQEAIVQSEASGNTIFLIMSHIGMADIHLVEAALPLAAKHYQAALALYGEHPLPSSSEAFSGMAQVYYEWNQLDDALEHAKQGVHLGRQWEKSDTPIRSEWIIASVYLARGEQAKAEAQLIDTIHFMQQHGFVRHLENVVTSQLRLLLASGRLEEAATLVKQQDMPLAHARVALATGDSDHALALLAATQQTLKATGRRELVLRATLLQAMVYDYMGEHERALQKVVAALVQAEPSGYIRLFVDEGTRMAALLGQVLPTAEGFGISQAYITTLVDAMAVEDLPTAATSGSFRFLRANASRAAQRARS